MIGVILLAGGKGLRFGSERPKQFLKLKEKEIALYSLEVFTACPQVSEIVIVTPLEYEPLFTNALLHYLHFRFARPGIRRQDSVENGLLALSSTADWVCVHDAARPFISLEILERLFAVKQEECFAATVAIQATSTIKECTGYGWVSKTLNRERVWEIQTPQLIYRPILEKGFAFAKFNNLTVTDDVSLAELVDCKVKLIEGHAHNIKVTKREDFLTAEILAETRNNICAKV